MLGCSDMHLCYLNKQKNNQKVSVYLSIWLLHRMLIYPNFLLASMKCISYNSYNICSTLSDLNYNIYINLEFHSFSLQIRKLIQISVVHLIDLTTFDYIVIEDMYIWAQMKLVNPEEFIIFIRYICFLIIHLDGKRS